MNLFDKKNKEEKIDEYLKPKLWKYKNKIYHKELEEKFEKIKNSMNKDEIRKLNNELKNKKINEENEEDEFKMIKLDDLNDIKEKDEEKLKENIFVVRKIYKDNNSFYRCVIFSIFENMVLTNNILFFKELLIEIDFIVSSENNRNKELFPDETLINDLQLNIKAEMVKNLLYILIKSMEKSITSSYELLLKLFTDIEIEFDASIILLVRYLLCFYIDENKYKTYSKEEKIDVGDLIPQKYKEMHIFLQKKFELFFINELLKLKSYDNKIIYYLLPYFFDTSLNIIYYYPNSKNSVYQNQYGIKEDKDDFDINLFYYKNSCNIYYTNKFYEFHKKIIDKIDKNNNKEIIKEENNILNEEEKNNNEINEDTFKQ